MVKELFDPCYKYKGSDKSEPFNKSLFEFESDFLRRIDNNASFSTKKLVFASKLQVLAFLPSALNYQHNNRKLKFLWDKRSM
jgi:hypothetical protein